MLEVEVPRQVWIGPPDGGWNRINAQQTVILVLILGALCKPVLNEQLVSDLWRDAQIILSAGPISVLPDAMHLAPNKYCF